MKFQSGVFRIAFRDSLPVFSGYFVLGAGYGILMQNAGFSPLFVFLTSLLVYAGSLQYALIGLLSSGASLLSVIFTSFAVNIRHLFYGISMLKKYEKQPLKPLLIYTLTDETYALVSNGEHEGPYYHYVSLLDYAYWTLSCTLGALIGRVLPFDMSGIDFSLTALFLSVAVEQWLSSDRHDAALIGAISSVVCLMIFGKDNFLIPSMGLIMVALILLRRKGGRRHVE